NYFPWGSLGGAPRTSPARQSRPGGAKRRDMAKLFRSLSSKLKSSLDALLQPADDPREAFADPLARQQALLVRVREALVQNTALRARLEQRSAQLGALVSQLEQAARQAIAQGSEAPARLSLQQRQVALGELKSLSEHVKEIQLEENRIGLIEQRLSAQM